MDALARRVRIDAHAVGGVEDRVEDAEVGQRVYHVGLPLRQGHPEQAPAARTAAGGAELLGVARVHALPVAGLLDDALELLHLLWLQEAAYVVHVLDLSRQVVGYPPRLGHGRCLQHLVQLGDDGFLGALGAVIRRPRRLLRVVWPPVGLEATHDARGLLEGAEVPLPRPAGEVVQGHPRDAAEPVGLQMCVLRRRECVLEDVNLETHHGPL
mmetsp:Transcript_69828/g.158427  ORF Transcript_69828/g.158427 Transcript_69828/m.158427 type:complete len:212 (-) Transcript_69828:139-774(-)